MFCDKLFQFERLKKAYTQRTHKEENPLIKKKKQKTKQKNK